MSLKLKLDENGNVVVQDGMPVYVHPDGKEVPFDAARAMNRIKDLNTEAKQNREAAQAAEAALAQFEGFDLEAARNALQVVKNLDDKKLVDAGEIEALKKNLSTAHEESLNSTRKAYETKLKQTSERVVQLEQNIHELMILGAFERSKFLQEQTMLTPDLAYARFKDGMRIEQDALGKPIVVGYLKDATGKEEKIYSLSRPGELASPEECVEALILAHPQKDRFLAASGKRGSGADGGDGNGGTGEDLQTQYEAARKANNVPLMVSLKRKIAAQAASGR